MRRVSNPPNPWHTTHAEFLGEPPEAELEVFEEEARSIVSENDSPDIGFRYSVNPYRGCFHACAYCVSGETLVLLASGQPRPISEVRVGDEIYGTRRQESDVFLEKTTVLDHWQVKERAYRLKLTDGRALVSSGGHRFLTRRGWRPVRCSKHESLAAGDEMIARSPNTSSFVANEPIQQQAPPRVESIEPLGVELPLYDITTGTGDFIANGVVSHNCYARPTHQYLDWGAGTDFERKIVVKVNAPELLRQRLARKSWTGETIVFSGVTDCYQPLEAVYGITRRCLEVLLEFRNPVGIVTKGALVRRDRELISRLAQEAGARVFVSIAFADDAVARLIEPNVAPPSQRFEAMAALSEAGIETGIGTSPIIPGLNDSDLPKLLARARAAGATRAFMTLLRLPAEVLPVFEERLAEAFPQRTKKIWHAIEEMRGGRRNDPRFGSRMSGAGPRWEALERVFQVETRRLGLNDDEMEMPRSSTYRRPERQKGLFDGAE